MATSQTLNNVRPKSATLPIGMIAAFPREIRPLLKGRSKVCSINRASRENPRRKIYSLELANRAVILTVAGAGAENSYQSARGLMTEFALGGLISVGFAGALSPALRAGDVVLASEVLDQITGERFYSAPGLLPIRCSTSGKLLSASAVISSCEEKLRLGKQWEALAVDMESAGVARAAAQAGLPFAAVKSITDSAERSLSIDFNRCRREDKDFSLWAIARQSLATSKGVRDLWMLARNSRQAAATLAAALAFV